jgi:hypothetical protein
MLMPLLIIQATLVTLHQLFVGAHMSNGDHDDDVGKEV